jgi:hypothetical protein
MVKTDSFGNVEKLHFFGTYGGKPENDGFILENDGSRSFSVGAQCNGFEF